MSTPIWKWMRRRWRWPNLSDGKGGEGPLGRRIGLLLLPALLLLLTAASGRDPIRANKAYEEGDYELAAELYLEALQSEPENSRLHFNLASSLAMLGRMEEAMQAYEEARALTEDLSEQALSEYNMGNLLAWNSDPAAAAELYREALRKNPMDADARHNYELARKEHEQLQQQMSGETPENDEEEENRQQESEPDSRQGETPPDEPPADSGSRQQQEMSREEAENILDALQQRERDLLESMQKRAETENPDEEKDW